MPTSRTKRRRIKQQKRSYKRRVQANTRRTLPQKVFPTASRSRSHCFTRQPNGKMTSPYQRSMRETWPNDSMADYHQFEPDPTGWFDLMSIDLPCIQTLCQWCTNGIRETLHFTKEALFPSLRYKRELQVTVERLQAVEQELQAMKNKTEVTVLCGQPPCTTPQPGQHCSFCRCRSQQSNSSQPPESLSAASTSQTTAPPPPPLPPPPPPPPPPSMFKPSGPLKIVKKQHVSCGNETPKSSTLVTLKDIQNVKLRKVVLDTDSCTPIMKRSDQPLVTAADLTGVSLRKTGASQSVHTPNMRDRISQEVLQFHSKLRRVDIKRSPGGTPVNNKKWRRDSGSGLTPMMTRALKRKFLLALSRSPSPASCEDKENRRLSLSDQRGSDHELMS